MSRVHSLIASSVDRLPRVPLSIRLADNQLSPLSKGRVISELLPSHCSQIVKLEPRRAVEEMIFDHILVEFDAEAGGFRDLDVAVLDEGFIADE